MKQHGTESFPLQTYSNYALCRHRPLAAANVRGRSSRVFHYCAFIATVAIARAVSAQTSAELAATTSQIRVENYYAVTQNGSYRQYRALGFYEPGSPSTKPRFFLLPKIAVDLRSLKFYSANGSVIVTRTGGEVVSVDVPLRYSASLPSESESIGIAAQLPGGEPQEYYLKQPLLNTFGQPRMAPVVPADVVANIHATYNGYNQALQKQAENRKKWVSYQSEIVVPSELRLSLLIDGDIVATRYMGPSSYISGGSSMPPLSVKSPTAYVVQRLRDGNFEVNVEFRFRDSKVGSVDAKFDVLKVIENYVKETQRAITSSKSTGMQIFHIGSRKNRVKQMLDESLEYDGSTIDRANTVIVTNDADEMQLARFDALFFPKLSQDAVVKGHLEAAEAARTAGKPDLAAAHTKYAEALQKDVPMAEVDAVGAAAAFNEGDYATFIAKGVRFMDAKTKTSGDFIRVAKEKVTSQGAKEFTDVSKRSVNRAVNLHASLEEEVKYRPSMGVIGSIPRPGGIILTCLAADGPLAQAGVANGEAVSEIGGTKVASFSDIESALSGQEPGDSVAVKFIDPNGFTLTRNIVLGQGLPR
jgi:hypothetical protein